MLEWVRSRDIEWVRLHDIDGPVSEGHSWTRCCFLSMQLYWYQDTERGRDEFNRVEDGKRKRETQTDRDRQCIQTYYLAQTEQIDKQREEKKVDTCPNMQTSRQANRQTDLQMDKTAQSDRQAHKQTNGQTNEMGKITVYDSTNFVPDLTREINFNRVITLLEVMHFSIMLMID